MSGLILHNANIITMDTLMPKAEAIVIQDGIIREVCGNERIPYVYLSGSDTKIIDCNGRTIVPGFIDAHGHIPGYCESLISLNLSPRENIRSIADLQKKIKSACLRNPDGTWIRGKHYDEFYFAEKRHPNRHDLDNAAPNHPVKLTHRSSYAHVLNSAALKLAGITAETEDPSDGIIDRDLSTGEPTGILYNMGTYLSQRIPAPDNSEIKRGAELASEKLLSYGITRVHDASALNGSSRWEMFREIKRDGIFKPGIKMMFGLNGFNEMIAEGNVPGSDVPGLSCGGVKIILSETTGRLNPAQEELNDLVLEIHSAGMQAIMHAVDESGVRAACDAVGYALQKEPRPDHRHRIEHCSVCPPALVKRIKALGICVVTQPSFIYFSGDRYLKTVALRLQKYLYPAGTLKRKGIVTAGSSDFPVVDPNPMTGIFAAITRNTESGQILSQKECIEPEDAIGMFTFDAAKAMLEENVRGSLTPGKQADIVVLSDDPTDVPPHKIKSIKVEKTIIGGEIVWERK
jgi:predicted amidohydrolase YtcJ